MIKKIGKSTNDKKKSIKQKLMTTFFSLVVALSAVSIILLIMINYFNSQYNQILNNILLANTMPEYLDSIPSSLEDSYKNNSNFTSSNYKENLNIIIRNLEMIANDTKSDKVKYNISNIKEHISSIEEKIRSSEQNLENEGMLR